MADVDGGFGDRGAVFEVVGELCGPMLARGCEKGGGLSWETHVVFAGTGCAEEGRRVATVGWGRMCVAVGVVGPVDGLGSTEVGHGGGFVGEGEGEVVGVEGGVKGGGGYVSVMTLAKAA